MLKEYLLVLELWAQFKGKYLAANVGSPSLAEKMDIIF